MSKSHKSQLVFLLRILECCGKIIKYGNKGSSPNEFFLIEDQAFFNASLTLLVQLAEQTIKLDNAIKENLPDIPWSAIKGFGNLAVHEYEYIESEKVFDIVKKEIPDLKLNIELFVKEGISKGVLSLFELNLSVGSEFYSHVDFENILPK
jgi:uncharacterized protein with HEPN domain